MYSNLSMGKSDAQVQHCGETSGAQKEALGREAGKKLRLYSNRCVIRNTGW